MCSLWRGWQPRPQRAQSGLIPGPGSPVRLKHLHGNHSDKLPAALPAEAPKSQAMDAPANSQFCPGSQRHMSIGTGPRTAGSEGIQL